MVFKPKYKYAVDGIYKVDAQTAGEELERIYGKYGTIDPAQIVNESRKESAPLHPVFEWDDTVAAEKFRENQASGLVRAIVQVGEGENQPAQFRAFVHVTQDYMPIRVAIETPGLREQLLLNAFREMESFKRKYQTLNQLAPVFAAIDDVTRAAG